MTAYWVACSKINDLARGGKFKIVAGPQEYQEAPAFRKSGAVEVELVIVEAGDATK